MAALDTTVCYYTSAMANAPTLSGTAGALIGVLDACLVNGFGSMTATSVTVSAGIATANFAAQHAAIKYAVVEVAGATPAGLNGRHKVVAVSGNSVSFDADGIADGTASGTITVKVASAGWEKTYSGTNVAVYRSVDPQGTQKYLRVDDTGTTDARVVGYNAMTDVNTGTDPFPSAAEISAGGYWGKANTTSGTRNWQIWADTRTVYFAEEGIAGYRRVWPWGDFAPQKSGDPDCCLIATYGASLVSAQSAWSDAEYVRAAVDATAGRGYNIARDYAGLSAGIKSVVQFMASPAAGYAGATGLAFPNPVDNGIVMVRGYVFEGASSLRGRIRGMRFSPQAIAANLAHQQVLPNQVDARDWMVARSVSTGTPGTAFIDVTGPWD